MKKLPFYYVVAVPLFSGIIGIMSLIYLLSIDVNNVKLARFITPVISLLLAYFLFYGHKIALVVSVILNSIAVIFFSFIAFVSWEDSPATTFNLVFLAVIFYNSLYFMTLSKSFKAEFKHRAALRGARQAEKSKKLYEEMGETPDE